MSRLKPQLKTLLYPFQAIYNDVRDVYGRIKKWWGRRSWDGRNILNRLNVDVRVKHWYPETLIDEPRELPTPLNYKVIKQILGAVLALFIIMALAFANTPPQPTHDGIQPPKLSHMSSVRSITATFSDYQYKEPHIEEIFNTAPGANDFQPGQCVWGVARWINVPIIGNANQWPANAQAAGYTVTNVPYKGAVGISMAGYYGHAVLIEAVEGDNVLIREMNHIAPFVEDERLTPKTDWIYIYFGHF